jgi:hypothetical protein
MSNKCVNYKFCKGVAFPELDIELCLLCDKWYEHGEGWGPLEFIENDDDCAVCYSKGIKMKFPTNCEHAFCIQCCRNLLYHQEDINDICPVSYGCKPCKHYIEGSVKSCKNRPCCDEDQLVLDEFEEKDYDKFIEWNYNEFNLINTEKDYLVTKKCPMCRKVYERKIN